MSFRNAISAVSLGAVVCAFVAGCGGTKDDRPAEWSFISAAIVEPSCATASCHSSVAQKAGVDLSTREIGFKNLTTRNFVVKNDPTNSELMYLLEAKDAKRMPPDFALPEEDIALIYKWIAAGAPNN